MTIMIFPYTSSVFLFNYPDLYLFVQVLGYPFQMFTASYKIGFSYPAALDIIHHSTSFLLPDAPLASNSEVYPETPPPGSGMLTLNPSWNRVVFLKADIWKLLLKYTSIQIF